MGKPEDHFTSHRHEVLDMGKRQCKGKTPKMRQPSVAIEASERKPFRGWDLKSQPARVQQSSKPTKITIGSRFPFPEECNPRYEGDHKVAKFNLNFMMGTAKLLCGCGGSGTCHAGLVL